MRHGTHFRQPSQAFEARGDALLCIPRNLLAGRRNSAASSSSISTSSPVLPLLVSPGSSEFPVVGTAGGQPGTGTSKDAKFFWYSQSDSRCVGSLVLVTLLELAAIFTFEMEEDKKGDSAGKQVFRSPLRDRGSIPYSIMQLPPECLYALYARSIVPSAFSLVVV